LLTSHPETLAFGLPRASPAIDRKDPVCAARASSISAPARPSAFTQQQDYAEPSAQLAANGQRSRELLGITRDSP
jgi:hypothetical protein